ncbi:PEP-CTERM sorting domain-containing protein [Methylomonas albis]|uniref:PEP-CTERM sorting domain-containing protein n=1 Tax=Methylomonas albis TaxID=1854563 RepID=A0ABR9CXJ2_9GAMM|nr:PEP-CTERM sorting domain-containing protein [Methylomonas albis]MBD9355592.1 PEP-CTERM sorting domain-containing protein [Methylomonas albis]
MINTKLAKAVSLAVAGVALSAGSTSALASTTMYNTFNAFGSAQATDANSTGTQPTTDGWTHLYDGADVNTVATGVESKGHLGTVVPWVGTTGGAQPFGYTGSAPLNWAIQLGSASDSGVISQADSTKYGIFADIDTAKGAWSDASLSGASGWRHNIDIGLFKADVATDVKLSAAGLTQAGTNFGFTIFKGLDTLQGDYGHHGSWNNGNNSAGVTSTSLFSAATSFTTADIVAYSVGGATPSNINDIIFHADAGQVYTIVLGGYRNGAWGNTGDGYVLNVQAVPVPGAVWLFGSAMAGLIGFGGRRKAAVTA